MSNNVLEGTMKVRAMPRWSEEELGYKSEGMDCRPVQDKTGLSVRLSQMTRLSIIYLTDD